MSSNCPSLVITYSNNDNIAQCRIARTGLPVSTSLSTRKSVTLSFYRNCKSFSDTILADSQGDTHGVVAKYFGHVTATVYVSWSGATNAET